MIRRLPLGDGGPVAGVLGYGAMGLEGYYGPSDDQEAARTLNRALDAGMTLVDTADAYGDGRNETLVGRALAGRRNECLLATKFGIVFDPAVPGTRQATNWGFELPINGRPEYAARALDASLARLGTDAVDLWYLHYPDPAVPIEETVGAMARAVRAGKARHLGLSNVTPEQVRRARAVHPITAVQYEYSLWRREAEAELLPTLRQLGIALVAWSPLGAGFLAGAVTAAPQDFRQHNPRYQGANLDANRARFAPFLGLAAELGASPAQLALAWLLHQGPDVFPIPGTRRPERVDENARAADLALDPATLARIDVLARPGLAQGATLL